MARTSILPIKSQNIEIDIYSNKSSLLLFWLLCNHSVAEKDGFSVNALARDIGLSVGLTHKVIKQLVYNGIVIAKGLRTNKRFYLKLPKKLLTDWILHYSLIKKTKTKGFAAPAAKITEVEIKKLGLIPALHTAAEYFHIKSTNLRSKEYYVRSWEDLPKAIAHLDLQELDRGYELLLVKPYYSSLIEKIATSKKQSHWDKAYTLLTILDLYYFPIRGGEQAEVIFQKNEFLKSICTWKEIENAVG